MKKAANLLKKVCVLWAVGIFAITVNTAAAASDKIDIGYIATLTGFASEILKIQVQGAEIAKDLINDRGGISINGKKYLLNLIVEDTKGSPDGAVAAANRLVYDKKVKFIGGIFPTFFIKATMSVTEAAGVLHSRCYNTATKDEYGPHTPYSFVSHLGTAEFYRSAFKYLTEHYPDVKTIAFIVVDDGQIRDNDSIVRKTAAEFGLTIKGDIIGWSPSTVDWAPYATKALKMEPDAIMTGNGGTIPTGSILKYVRQMGYTKPVFGCNMDPAIDIKDVAGKEAATNFFQHGISESTPDMAPITKEISKRAMARYGRFDMVQLFGFNSIYTMVQAIEAAQSLDPDKVKAVWEKMDTIETGYGPGRMGGIKTYGINHSVFHRVPIQVLEKRHRQTRSLD